MPEYVERTLESVARRSMTQFPGVVITGPRQSGKTTLARRIAQPGTAYVSLEDPDVRQAATSDPRGFLAHHRTPVILDEVQRTPALLSYIKTAIDERRHVAGQYLLTGSQNLLLLESVTETLAGRVALLTLMPFTQRELDGSPDAPFPWEGDGRAPGVTTARDWFERLLRTSFPDPALGTVDPGLWATSYIGTYLERDVRSVLDVKDLVSFNLFIRAIAARTGTALDLASIARDIGVAPNTAKSWLSVLVTSHLVFLLPPYHTNVGKRLVKRPKVYFADVGLACRLMGITDPDLALGGPTAGALFETAVVSEVRSTLLHRGIAPELYFWGISGRAEVDILVRDQLGLVPLEAKLNATPVARFAQPMKQLRELLGATSVSPGWVVHPGHSTLPLGGGDRALPFGSL